MPINISEAKIDSVRTAQRIQTLIAEVVRAKGEYALDFSDVERLDAGSLVALENLADAADRNAVKVIIRGASVEFYKLLKLIQLASRFSFESKDEARRARAGSTSA